MSLLALFNYTHSLRGDSARIGPLIGSTCGNDVIKGCAFSKEKPPLPPAVMHGCVIPAGSRQNLSQALTSMLLIAILTGCAARSRPKSFLPNVNIPVECATSIRLVDCDLSVSPPHCRASAVTYRKGCEQVMAIKQEP